MCLYAWMAKFDLHSKNAGNPNILYLPVENAWVSLVFNVVPPNVEDR